MFLLRLGIWASLPGRTLLGLAPLTSLCLSPCHLFHLDLPAWIMWSKGPNSPWREVMVGRQFSAGGGDAKQTKARNQIYIPCGCTIDLKLLGADGAHPSFPAQPSFFRVWMSQMSQLVLPNLNALPAPVSLWDHSEENVVMPMKMMYVHSSYILMRVQVIYMMEGAKLLCVHIEHEFHNLWNGNNDSRVVRTRWDEIQCMQKHCHWLKSDIRMQGTCSYFTVLQTGH